MLPGFKFEKGMALFLIFWMIGCQIFVCCGDDGFTLHPPGGITASTSMSGDDVKSRDSTSVSSTTISSTLHDTTPAPRGPPLTDVIKESTTSFHTTISSTHLDLMASRDSTTSDVLAGILGSTTDPANQEPVRNLVLGPQRKVRVNNVTMFHARADGTDVHYNWSMGDGTEHIDAGPIVSHVYTSLGRFVFQVVAYNRLNSVSEKIFINVQDYIQGVTLMVTQTIVRIGTPVEFIAVSNPNVSYVVDLFEWNFGDPPDSRPSISPGMKITHTYSKAPGNYTVNVTALNSFSQRTSAPLVLQVFSVIPGLSVSMGKGGWGDVCPPGVEVIFEAYHYRGSSVTYTWNFGDSVTVIRTTTSNVSHTFSKPGEYRVRVSASNPISSQTAQMTVFVMMGFCRTPIVAMIGTQGMPLQRSSPVRVEANVTVSCGVTNSTVYAWTLRNVSGAGGGGEAPAVNISQLGVVPANDPVLYVPAYALSYGNYTAQLKVQMADTIVYGQAPISYSFSIVPAPPRAIIRGGLRTEVGRVAQIILDGSASIDPDLGPDAVRYSNLSTLRYNWLCTEHPFLNELSRQCFTDTQGIQLNSSILRIPGALFKVQSSAFLFVLMVSRANGSAGVGLNGSAQQLIVMKNDSTINISISCPQCEDLWVNANERTSLEAVVSGNSSNDLTYDWTLWSVLVATSTPLQQNRVDVLRSCIQVEGQSNSFVYNSFASNASTSANQSHVSESTAEPLTDDPSEGSRVTPAALITESTSSGRDEVSEQSTVGLASTALPSISTSTKAPAGGGNGGLLNPEEGGIMAVGRSRGSGRGGSGGAAANIPPVEEGSAGAGRPSLASATNPTPDAESSSNGSAAAAKPPGGDTGGAGPLSPGKDSFSSRRHSDATARVPQTDKSEKESSEKKAFDDQAATGEPTLFTAHRNLEPLGSEPAGQSLVIAENSLTPGKTYVVQVVVRHKVTGVTGTSQLHFKVNDSPGLGRCSLTQEGAPVGSKVSEGKEMSSYYNVYCVGWMDTDRPLSYEVSYIQSPLQPPTLVYTGFSSSIRFQLPAGDPGYSYSVRVGVAISDRLGGKTSVCSTYVTVLPSNTSYASTHLLGLLSSSVLQKADQGDNRNARLNAFMLSTLLNRAEPGERYRQPSGEAAAKGGLYWGAGDVARDLASIRGALVGTLLGLPLRDLSEVQQTLCALVSITTVKHELNAAALPNASSLMTASSLQAVALLNQLVQDDYQLSALAMQSVSNIIVAARGAVTQTNETIGRAVVKQAIEVAGAILQAKLGQEGSSEAAVTQSTDDLSGYALRTRSPILSIRDDDRGSSFSISSSALQRVVGCGGNGCHGKNGSRWGDGGAEENCYQANLVTFGENPYAAQAEISDMGSGAVSKLDVVSLELFSCLGHPLNVSGLTEQQGLVDILIAHQQDDNSSDTSYVLRRQFMNVHAFNLSTGMSRNILHIDIALLDDDYNVDLRLFPVIVMLRSNKQPTLTESSYSWSYPLSQTSISLSLNASALTAFGSVHYLGMLDGSYNQGSPRLDQATARGYTLRIWSGDCIYWDEGGQGGWSDKGCSMVVESSYYQSQCRCNHLTSFSAHLYVAASTLTYCDISQFFVSPLNLNVVAFLASVLLVYVVLLLLLLKLDRHDLVKLRPIPLVDNMRTDRQKYAVTLETGFRRHAGTSAKVSIVLHGEYGMSETRELLSQSGQPLFERNSRDTFYMTFPDSLGPLFKVQLWHNNAGPSPSWYLSRVTVCDICTGETYYFVCEKWFAVEKEDGKVEREMMVTEKGLKFSKVLRAKSTQYATDYHLWLSVFIKPSYSRFTRAQRLVCLLCLIVSYTAVSGAWYQTSYMEYPGEFSLIDVSLKSITVGVLSSLVVLPAILFIALIFRLSKARRRLTNVKPESAADEVDYEARAGESRGADVEHRVWSGPSVLDQTLLTWQGLQEWAERTWAKRFQQSPVGGSTQSVAIQHINTLNQHPNISSNARATTASRQRSGDVSAVRYNSVEASIRCISGDNLTMREAARQTNAINDLLTAEEGKQSSPCRKFVRGDSGSNAAEDAGVLAARRQSSLRTDLLMMGARTQASPGKEVLMIAARRQSSLRENQLIARRAIIGDNGVVKTVERKHEDGDHNIGSGDRDSLPVNETVCSTEIGYFGSVKENKDETTEERNAYTTRDRDSRSRKGRKSCSIEGRGSSTTDRRESSCTVGTNSSAKGGTDSHATDRRSSSMTEWRDSMSAGGRHSVTELRDSVMEGVDSFSEQSYASCETESKSSQDRFTNDDSLDYSKRVDSIGVDSKRANTETKLFETEGKRSQNLKSAFEFKSTSTESESRYSTATTKSDRETTGTSCRQRRCPNLVCQAAGDHRLSKLTNSDSGSSRGNVTSTAATKASTSSPASSLSETPSSGGPIAPKDPSSRRSQSTGGSSGLHPLAGLPRPSYGGIQGSGVGGRKATGRLDRSSSSRSLAKSLEKSDASRSCGSRRAEKADRFLLPWYCVYFAWTLSGMVISGSATVAICYGIRFTQAQSTLWLQSVFFSILQCVFVTHPIIVILMSLRAAWSYENDLSVFDHHDYGVATLCTAQTLDDAELYCGEELRAKGLLQPAGTTTEQVVFYLKGVSEPTNGHGSETTVEVSEICATPSRAEADRGSTSDDEESKLLRTGQVNSEGGSFVLRHDVLRNEAILFVAQFLLLLFIAFGKNLRTEYDLNSALTQTFVRRNDPVSFYNVSSVTEWWRWSRTVFVDQLYNNASYNQGYVDNCMLIGAVNLRQLRVQEQNCSVRIAAPASCTETCTGAADACLFAVGSCDPSASCLPLYSAGVESTQPYVAVRSYWHKSAADTGSSEIDGRFATYGGDGYLITLSNNRTEVELTLAELQRDKWIDNYTSAIVFDFTLFHAPSNLFTTVTLLLEIPPLGRAFTSWRIVSSYLYKYISAMDKFILACELLFFLATLLKVHREANQIVHHGVSYIKNVWNVLEVSQCLISLALIVAFTYRFLLVDAAVERMRASYYSVFVDISTVAAWDEVLRDLVGFVLLLVALQLLKSLRHHQPFATYTNIYSHAALDIVVFGCMACVWLGAYASLGLALFSENMSEMRTMSHSIGSMAGLMTRSYAFNTSGLINMTQVVVWHIFIMTFCAFVIGSVSAYILAILTFYYKVFKDEPKLLFSASENLSYLASRVRSMVARITGRWRGREAGAAENKEQELNTLPLEFTMAEIQYQVDEMLFKMNSLSGASNLPEKPRQYFTDSETNYGGSSGAGSEVRTLDESKLQSHLRKIKENLFGCEPHLTQLLGSSLVSGTLSQDAEKQLILQLELETLRRLQMNRRGNSNNSNQSNNSNNDTDSNNSCVRTSSLNSRDSASSNQRRRPAPMTLTSAAIGGDIPMTELQPVGCKVGGAGEGGHVRKLRAETEFGACGNLVVPGDSVVAGGCQGKKHGGGEMEGLDNEGGRHSHGMAHGGVISEGDTANGRSLKNAGSRRDQSYDQSRDQSRDLSRNQSFDDVLDNQFCDESSDIVAHPVTEAVNPLFAGLHRALSAMSGGDASEENRPLENTEEDREQGQQLCYRNRAFRRDSECESTYL